MRVEGTNDPLDTFVLFFRHKIIHTLYPNNFIDTIGVVSKRQPEPNKKGEQFSSYLFSKKSPISDDHAIFCSHMDITKKIDRKYLCMCDICKDHRNFHLENNLGHKAKIFNSETSPRGIYFPFSDHTDYCLIGDNLMFFEADLFLIDMVENSVKEIEDTPQGKLLKMYFNRYRFYQNKKNNRRMIAGNYYTFKS